jgi:hypothetical protein
LAPDRSSDFVSVLEVDRDFLDPEDVSAQRALFG